MTAIRGKQAWLTSWAWSVVGLAVLWPLLGRGQDASIDAVHYEVRVVRYAALGDSGCIPGDDDTPEHEQAWLDAIAAALNECSGFFYELGSSGGDTTYTAVTLSVQPDPATGKITAGTISAELGKVTWIVKTVLYYDVYDDHHDWNINMAGGGTSFSAALAGAIASQGVLFQLTPADYGWDNYRGFGQGSIGSVTRWYAGDDGCEYNVCLQFIAIAGRYKAPGYSGVAPVPIDPNRLPAAAEVEGFYLGKHGGPVLPDALHGSFDKMWPEASTPPAPPTPSCPAEVGQYSDTNYYGFDNVEVTLATRC